ncbi:hypothetical protein BASA81_008659 [Batrachochytrium salamandrivorans]|nr:hypothetical protein BASA81_008659 [Batrachochytrium salamandrivorans]
MVKSRTENTPLPQKARKPEMRWVWLLCLAAAVVVLGEIQIQVQPAQARYSANESVLVNVIMFGTGQIVDSDNELTFDSFNKQFVVKFNSTNEVAYLGRLGKRAQFPPVRTVQNYTLHMQVDLSTLYEFTQSGEYSFQYQSPFFPNQQSNVIVAYVEQRSAILVLPRSVPCSSSRTNQYKQAKVGSQALAKSALANTNINKYKLWFGPTNKNRQSTVKQVYSKISKALQGNLQIDCECANNRNLFAYVYPSRYRTKTVYLCGAFWSARAVGGADSQAGVLIHELSHFNDIGKTQDYVYGQSKCQSLAKNNPSRAIKNADSYEYFAEL